MNNTPTPPDNSVDDICRLEKLSDEYPDLISPGQAKWLTKTRHTNGLAETGAVLKISNKLYIIKSKFFDWFMRQKAP